MYPKFAFLLASRKVEIVSKGGLGHWAYDEVEGGILGISGHELYYMGMFQSFRYLNFPMKRCDARPLPCEYLSRIALLNHVH